MNNIPRCVISNFKIKALTYENVINGLSGSTFILSSLYFVVFKSHIVSSPKILRLITFWHAKPASNFIFIIFRSPRSASSPWLGSTGFLSWAWSLAAAQSSTCCRSSVKGCSTSTRGKRRSKRPYTLTTIKLWPSQNDLHRSLKLCSRFSFELGCVCACDIPAWLCKTMQSIETKLFMLFPNLTPHFAFQCYFKSRGRISLIIIKIASDCEVVLGCQICKLISNLSMCHNYRLNLYRV